LVSGFRERLAPVEFRFDAIHSFASVTNQLLAELGFHAVGRFFLSH
jgi:hypothetical protein